MPRLGLLDDVGRDALRVETRVIVQGDECRERRVDFGAIARDRRSVMVASMSRPDLASEHVDAHPNALRTRAAA